VKLSNGKADKNSYTRLRRGEIKLQRKLQMDKPI
jgi:hypothetical protein